MLQVESVVDIGWMLYSLRCMDAGALAEELFDTHGIEVGLRWKVIDQGLKGKIPSDQRISALHVEASLAKKSATIKALLSLYGRSTKEQKPNGIKFRFVTLRSSATSRASITKLDRLRIRQKKFLQKICQSSSWDIVHLDRSLRDNTPTLRQLIMTLTSSEYEKVSTFHSVDLDYNGDGFVFTYLPELRTEAESSIQTLFPLLRHHNKVSHTIFDDSQEQPNTTEDSPTAPITDDELMTFFTQEALDRTEDMYFDKTKKCIIDPLIDDNLEFVMEDDVYDRLLGPDVEIDHATLHIPGRPAPRVLESSIIPIGDADSISTFGGSLGARRNPPIRNRHLVGNFRPPSSDESVTSSNTTVTTDEFNSLNQRVESITSQLAQNQLQNNEIINLLRSSNNSINRDGQPSNADSNAGVTYCDASDGL